MKLGFGVLTTAADSSVALFELLHSSAIVQLRKKKSLEGVFQVVSPGIGSMAELDVGMLVALVR